MGEQSCKEGALLEIVFLRGYNSLGLVLGLGSGVQRGTFGAGWSARPRQLAGWQDWFGLVEFQSFGRTELQRRVFVGDCSFEGIQQLRACTRFGLGCLNGYLWSWVVGETSPVGRVTRLVWTG